MIGNTLNGKKKMTIEEATKIFDYIFDENYIVDDEWFEYLNKISPKYCLIPGREFVTTYDVLKALHVKEDLLDGNSLIPIAKQEAVDILDYIFFQSNFNSQWQYLKEDLGYFNEIELFDTLVRVKLDMPEMIK
jgi:hypothetical protein